MFQDKKNIFVNLKEKEKDQADKVVFKVFFKSVLYGKFSKWDGDCLGFLVFFFLWKGVIVEDSFIGFWEYGFLFEVVFNFLALLGWNFGDEQEMFKLEEFVDIFLFEWINKLGSCFNIDKVKWFNQQYMIKVDDVCLVCFVCFVLEVNG